jgi:hypothetical protein
MFGESAPNGVSSFASSNSSVSVDVVTRRSKSVLLAATPSASAKTREPVTGTPSVKKSTSPFTEIEPSIPHVSVDAAAGLSSGSVSLAHAFTSTWNVLPALAAVSST